MGTSTERLSEIDRELESLGKSEQELQKVVARAKDFVASIRDLEALLASLGAGVPLRVVASPRKPEPRSEETYTPTPPSESKLVSSDIIGLSVDELFADAEVIPSSTPAEPGLSELFEDEGTSETGESQALADLFDGEEERAETQGELAALFDSEEPSAEPGAQGDLAALFDGEAAPESGDDELLAEDEELRLSDPDLEMEAVEEVEAKPRTMPPPAEDENEEEENTDFLIAREIARVEAEEARARAIASGDFEMLEDEEIFDVELEMDSEVAAEAEPRGEQEPLAVAATEEGPAEEVDEEDDDAPKKRGLFSRILGRK